MQKTVRVVGCVCVCAVALFGKHLVDRKNLSAHRAMPPVSEESAQYESHSLQRFSLGFENAISDLLWIRLIQTASHQKLEQTGVSWEYAQLNAITNLDRNYNRAYEFGSAFLSVFRQDKVGAKNILQKWTRNFPNKWKAHYIYGYHLYAEMGDFKNASREILTAAELPWSPPWLHSLGVGLMSETGAYLPALQIAIGLYPGISDYDAKIRLLRRIRNLRFHLQRQGWETALAKYREKSHREPSSLEDLNPYFEPQREIAQVEEEGLENDELRQLMTERFRFQYVAGEKKISGLLSAQDKYLESSGTYHK